jgi:hypothetical protein
MKKVIVLSALVLIAFFAKGQTEKNNWLMGGGIGFTSSTRKESDVPGSSTATAFQLIPGIGYFFINNLAAGLSLNLNSSHSSNSSSNGGGTSTMTYFTAGPFARYYFNASPHVKIFVHGDASWGSRKYDFNIGGNDENQPSIPISIYEGKAGAAFFLNRNVALEFTAGYQSMTEKDNSGGNPVKYTTGSLIIGVGFQLYLGPAKIKK